MARKRYDAAVKVREYQDREGKTKGEWLNVGAVIEYDDGGLSLMLNRTFNPAGLPDNGKGTVAISFFEPRERGEGNDSSRNRPASDFRRDGAKGNPPPPFDDSFDDLPF